MGKVRTVIDSRGVVQIATTGTPDLANEMGVNTSGFPGTSTAATALSGGTGALGAVDALKPGYYTIHSQSTCSLGSAATYPGGEYIFRVIQGDASSRPFLTGTHVAGVDKVFWLSGSADGTIDPPSTDNWASRVYLQPRGSIMLKSDAVYWHVMACSGTLSSSVGSLST